MTIRVLIVDDHGVVAEGLRFVIEAQPDMEVIDCIQDRREAVRRSTETRPDVVLMDHAVSKGNRYLSRQLADTVIDQVLNKSAASDPLQRLSSRERQVLQMLAEGYAVSDIATALSLSPKTVETYRARMMEKLDIRDFASLVKFAIQHGITALE